MTLRCSDPQNFRRQIVSEYNHTDMSVSVGLYSIIRLKGSVSSAENRALKSTTLGNT